MKREFRVLPDDPQAGISPLRSARSQFARDTLVQCLCQVDRETLVKLVSQRGDLNQEQVNQIIDRTQDAIDDIIRAPRRLAKRTAQQALDFEANLQNYLGNSNKEELNPEAIKRDLQLLLSSPRAGIESLSDRCHWDNSTWLTHSPAYINEGGFTHHNS